jgi:hypothetical protein
MPAVADERKVTVKPTDLANYLGVSRTYLSQALHNRWHAGGVDVELYAVWMTRNQDRVKHYELPERLARKIIPKSEYPKYDLR